MEENKVTAKEKLSYEELENIANQLNQQNQGLYKKLLEANMANAFKRLDYLFTALQFKDSLGEEFIARVVKEIEEMLDVNKPESEEVNPE